MNTGPALSTAELDKLALELEQLVAGLNQSTIGYEKIVQNEAQVETQQFKKKFRERFGNKNTTDQISPQELQQCYAYLLQQLKSDQFRQKLIENNGKMLLKKDAKAAAQTNSTHPLPRSLNMFIGPNGQLHVLLETKTKLAGGEKFQRAKAKTHGGVKHGTTSVLLWPRTPNVPNQRWFTSVTPLAQQSTAVSEREAAYSQPRHPFVQDLYVGHADPTPQGITDNPNARGMILGQFADAGSAEDEGSRNLKQQEQIFYSALMGVEHLHQQNIVHCDIKPANVLVFHDGPKEPIAANQRYIGKVHDFGFSYRIGVDAPTSMKGSVEFLPPEAIRFAVNDAIPKLKALIKNNEGALFTEEPYIVDLLTEGKTFDSPESIEDLYAQVQGYLEEHADELSLADIEFAKGLETLYRLTYSENFVTGLCGMPEPVAPENLQPYQANKSSDVFAVGVVILDGILKNKEMDLGGNDPNQLLHQLIHQPERLAELKQKIEKGSASPGDKYLYVAANCLQVDPAKRFTMSQVIAHLPDQQLVQDLRAKVAAEAAPVAQKPVTADLPAQRVFTPGLNRLRAKSAEGLNAQRAAPVEGADAERRTNNKPN